MRPSLELGLDRARRLQQLVDGNFDTLIGRDAPVKGKPDGSLA
ncbi:MAG: hypothetical protein ACREDU_12380 [Methylocella sp.]